VKHLEIIITHVKKLHKCELIIRLKREKVEQTIFYYKKNYGATRICGIIMIGLTELFCQPKKF